MVRSSKLRQWVPRGQTKFSKMMWASKEAEAMSGERAFLGRIGEPHECGGVVSAG